MSTEVTEAIGAAPYEWTDQRITSPNGVREREWDTRVATVEMGHSQAAPGVDPALPGSGIGSTSCATRFRPCREPPSKWRRRR